MTARKMPVPGVVIATPAAPAHSRGGADKLVAHVAAGQVAIGDVVGRNERQVRVRLRGTGKLRAELGDTVALRAWFDGGTSGDYAECGAKFTGVRESDGAIELLLFADMERAAVVGLIAGGLLGRAR